MASFVTIKDYVPTHAATFEGGLGGGRGENGGHGGGEGDGDWLGGEDEGQVDETTERKAADLRQKYELAMKFVSESNVDSALDLFAFITKEITLENTPSSSELERIQYLSFKNRSQLCEEKGDYEGALECALEAHKMDDDFTSEHEAALLFRICSLSIKLGDSWTPKMLLTFSNDPKNAKAFLPVAVKKLRADIARLEKSNHEQHHLDTTTPAALTPHDTDLQGSILQPTCLSENFDDLPSSSIYEESESSMNKNSKSSPRHNHHLSSGASASPSINPSSSTLFETSVSASCNTNPNPKDLNVGDRIGVFWKDDGVWYDATILGYNAPLRLHKIKYFDHVIEDLYLPRESFKLLSTASPYVNFGGNKAVVAATAFSSSLSSSCDPLASSSEEIVKEDALELEGVGGIGDNEAMMEVAVAFKEKNEEEEEERKEGNENTSELGKTEVLLAAPTTAIDDAMDVVVRNELNSMHGSSPDENYSIQFECLVEGCNRRRFLSRNNFRDHIRAHNGQDIPNTVLEGMDCEKCPKCGGIFSISGNGLYQHAKLKHSEELDVFIQRNIPSRLPANAVRVPITASVSSNPTTSLLAVKAPSSSSSSAASSSSSSSSNAAGAENRRSIRRKEMEDKIAEESIEEDVSFESRIAKLIDFIVEAHVSSDDDDNGEEGDKSCNLDGKVNCNNADGSSSSRRSTTLVDSVVAESTSASKFKQLFENVDALVSQKHLNALWANFGGEAAEVGNSFNMVSASEFLESIRAKFKIKESKSFVYEAEIFRAISAEICAYIQRNAMAGKVEDEYDVNGKFCFPSSDAISFVILNFTAKVIRTCPMPCCYFGNLDESLLVFESLVDTILNDRTSETAKMFSLEASEILRYLVQFITVHTAQICETGTETISLISREERQEERELQQDDEEKNDASRSLPHVRKLRYFWCLTLIIRSRRLSTSIDLQPFVSTISSTLEDLSKEMLDDDISLHLPHIKNSSGYVICRRGISLALVEIANHNEISRLESEISTRIASLSGDDVDGDDLISINDENAQELTDWLTKSLALINQIGDPLLLWGGNIRSSIVSHALHIASKLVNTEVLSQLYSMMLSSINRKYKANPHAWKHLVQEVYALLRDVWKPLEVQSNRVTDLRTEIIGDSFVYIKSTWLLAYEHRDKMSYKVITDMICTLQLVELESVEDSLQTLSAMISNRALELDFTLPLIPILSIITTAKTKRSCDGDNHQASLSLFSGKKLEISLSVLLDLIANFRFELNHAHDTENTQLTQLLCLQGICFVLSLSPFIESDAEETRMELFCELMALTFDHYLELALLEVDDCRFGIKIGSWLMSCVGEMKESEVEFSRDQKVAIVESVSVIYYHIYGLPFTSTTMATVTDGGRRNTFAPREITSNEIPEIFTFVKYGEASGVCGKAEMRQVYNYLFKQTVLRDVSLANCSLELDECIFSHNGLDVDVFGSLLKRAAEDALSHNASRNNFSSFFSFKSMNEVQRRFYWNLVKVGIIEDPPAMQMVSDVELTGRLVKMDASILPVVHSLLIDVGYNPLHFESWARIVRELISLYMVVQDCISEVIVFSEISPQNYGYDGELDLHDILTSCKPSHAPHEFVPALVTKNNLLLEFITRVMRCIEQVYEFHNYDDDGEEGEILFGTYENMGNLYYQTSGQFPRGSIGRKEKCAKAIEYYEKAAKGFTHFELGGFAYLMCGKLSWMIFRDTSKSMDYYDLARKEKESFVGNKALRVGLLYQFHSTRIKSALQLAASYYPSNMEDDADDYIFEKELQRLEQYSDFASHSERLGYTITAGDKSTVQQRLETVIKTSFLGLKECRRLDFYDFRSVFRIAKVTHQLSKIPNFSHMSVPMPEIGFVEALQEISKLFDKKRPQIAAIWCAETTSCRYGQLLQRTLKFDGIRRKYTDLYIDFLVEKCDIDRIMELLNYAIPIKVKPAAIVELILVHSRQVLSLVDSEFRRRREEEESSSSSLCFPLSSSLDLLGLEGEVEEEGVANMANRDTFSDLLVTLYELYFNLQKGIRVYTPFPRVSNGELSCTDKWTDLYQDIEGLMVELFQPEYLTDEFSIPPDSITSLEEARAMAENWSPFVMISFNIVLDYCSKRWKSQVFTRQQLPPILQAQPKSPPPPHKNAEKKSNEIAAKSTKDVTLTKRQRALILQEQQQNEEQQANADKNDNGDEDDDHVSSRKEEGNNDEDENRWNGDSDGSRGGGGGECEAENKKKSEIVEDFSQEISEPQHEKKKMRLEDNENIDPILIDVGDGESNNNA